MIGDATAYDWRLIFLLHAALSLICNVFFCFVATAKPAWWTDEETVELRTKTCGALWWWCPRPQQQIH
ncbi:unnamed protein product [Gongylonema pulchrum]|uniref:MFS domain-containing protein n=1 Tax=Gongylonema pulchrum TaxID=637853 RepID=A0A183EHC6_9BILA|nr:unnamed protein product [Gongylonema pulchrum]